MILTDCVFKYSTQFWLTNIQLNLSVLESTNPGFFFKIWLWRIQRWNVYALLTCHGISWCFCCFTFVVWFLCAAGNPYFDFGKNKDCFELHMLVLKLCNQIVFFIKYMENAYDIDGLCFCLFTAAHNFVARKHTQRNCFLFGQTNRNHNHQYETLNKTQCFHFMRCNDMLDFLVANKKMAMDDDGDDDLQHGA